MASADDSGGAGVQPGVLAALEGVLRERLVQAPEGSYSATLLRDPERAARKIMEEAFELCLELGRGTVDRERVTSEAADVLFHVLAAVVGAGSSLAEVEGELESRRQRGRGKPRTNGSEKREDTR